MKTLNCSSNKRNEYIDIVKGIAIILVVVGHCIQFGSGKNILESELFYKDPLFKFIYSFHMPLFMLISGYLYAYSINRGIQDILIRKIKSIIIPLIAWHTIYIGIKMFLGESYTPIVFFLSYFHSFWFLRALFFCSVIVLLMNRLFNDNIYAYIILNVLFLFIPNRILPNIFIFVLPYYIIGYLFKKLEGENIINSKKNIHTIYLISTLLFIALLFFFHDDYYVYVSNTCIIKSKHSPILMIYINLYRNLTALSGCCCCLLTIYYSYRKYNNYIFKTLLSLAYASLCIYIINSLLNEFALNYLPSIKINYLHTIAETIITIIIAYGIYNLLKLNIYTTSILLGGR